MLDVDLSAIDTVLPDGGLVSVIRDITEEKRRERDLKVLGNAIEYVPDEIVVWSQEGRLMIVNNAAQLAATATLGSKLRLGMHFRELLDLSYDMNFKNQTTESAYIHIAVITPTAIVIIKTLMLMVLKRIRL